MLFPTVKEISAKLLVIIKSPLAVQLSDTDGLLLELSIKLLSGMTQSALSERTRGGLQEILGAVSSRTITSVVHDDWLPASSVTVNVTSTGVGLA